MAEKVKGKNGKTVEQVAHQAAVQQEINARIIASRNAEDDKKGKKKVDPSKMTIYEYEQRYVKRENVRGAKFILWFAAGLIGVFLLFVLVSVFLKVYEINEYIGYGVGAVSLLIYIFVFIVPLIKILKTGYFVTNVNAYTASKAKRHNKKLRHNIAKKIIDLTAKVDGVGWYDSETVGKLAISLHSGDEEGVKMNLTSLYTGSVKRSAKQLIFKSSLKSAMYSALSQTSTVDSALVVLVNMQLIKDLVFLYGFRPSDSKLVKIFIRVIQNALIAYGLGSMQIGNGVVKTMGEAVRGIPLLGSAIAALVDSSVQGLTNGTLTTVIGFQTIKYMNDEYKLQNILDGIEIAETPEELKEACAELEKEIKKEHRRGKKAPVAA
ncbi:MAG: DUF697 domain-containing protein [Clostridiales bacterium]|nr:DUF697 domain-containing protein [Clostridiales bacterium]